jgi:hypothetical protein
MILDSSSADFIKDKGFLHQIGDQQYYIEIYLYNQLPDTEPLAVRFFFIDTLCIEESLMDWAVKGFLILNNDFETFERKSKENNDKAPFIFRTDGRNKMSINILPIIKEDSKISLWDGSIDKTSDEFKQKWQMSFDCVIYDIEDIDTKENKVKRRKLYFCDERYQILSEKNLEWSTAKEGMAYSLTSIGKGFLNDPNSTQMPTDDTRMIPANIAIRSILDTAGKNPDESYINIGFDEGGSIKSPNKKLSDCADLNVTGGNWVGGDTRNNIFYTSPAISTALEDLEYMIPYAGTDEEGPVFLRVSRVQKEKEWRLVSLRELFYRSKEEQVERLFLNEVDSGDRIGDKNKPYSPRAWADGGNDIFNFISGTGNKIISYQYSPMVSSDDKKIVNSPVHTYDFKNGMFHIVFGDNTAEGVVSKMENLAEAGLYNFVEKRDKAQILLNLNQTKKQSVSIDNVFLPTYFNTDNQRNANNFFSFYARNQMIKDALFLNEALSFTVRGLTIRAPGRFIFIDSIAGDGDPDPFSDRFLGQWMIIKVVHTFKQNSYFSNVVSTKVDAHSKLWEKEDTKF